MSRLDGRVAIVTGAGGGLGRAHALLLAAQGARVVVNDLGEAAQGVVDEIAAQGGEAIAGLGSVAEFETAEAIVANAVRAWGRVDILVNNAGILRDKSFLKMDLADFRLNLDVHLMGAVHCTKAAWGIMREQRYGRIVMTTSSSGLWGNFGQSNYGAAKMALVGLMQTLALEGASHGIRVNCIAPTAATKMMDGILPPGMLDLLRPELVSPALLPLVAEDAPTRTILCAGAGGFETANITLSPGAYIPDVDQAPEQVIAQWPAITDRAGDMTIEQGLAQSRLELTKAGYRFDETEDTQR